uniref:Phosphoribosyl-AMP cyclohydrolase domain-containing protein n=1 Tax=Proboscia inermis TaxID=420281 RepID=A0A7S0GFX6_9STRA
MFTTVVTTRLNEALGLVYSSKESVIAALECNRGVYYSRSRAALWRKGDTSGHYQNLHRIDIDCDADALRFTVTQRGKDVKAFCHLNDLTCWGKPTGFRGLEETLAKRMKDAPVGSYTKRLFNDPVLLRNKLVEEAQELSECVSRQHGAEEMADVLYFAMVKAATLGVTLDDVAVELDKRDRKVTRRKGDSKEDRIKAADAILKK